MTALRRVNFFDKKQLDLVLPNFGSTVSTLDGAVWVGTADGRLCRFDVAWNNTATISVGSGNIVQMCSSKQILIALLKTPDSSFRLLAYHMYRQELNGSPLLIGSLRLPLPATCVAVSSDFASLAVGCSNGHTLIYAGSTFGKPGAKPRILAPDDHSPVVAVKWTSNNVLFVITQNTITSVSVTTNAVEIINCEDDLEKSRSADTVSTLGSLLLVGREGTAFGYDAQQGNVCAIPIGNEIVRLLGWRDYFLTLTKAGELSICLSLSSGTRFMGYFGSQAEPILGICEAAFDGRSVVLFTARGVTILREKPVCDQLVILTGKYLFEWALDLAQEHSLPGETLAEIYKQYGDSFWEKGEWESAISVFKRAINVPLETSYVVNKFLNCPVEFLADYLEALIGTPSWTLDHTLLLILCYQSTGSTEQIRNLLGTIVGSELMKIITKEPQIVEYVAVGDLVRAIGAFPANAKELLEALIDNQEMDIVAQLVHELKESTLSDLMMQSRQIKSALYQTLTKTVSNPLVTLHMDFCTDAVSHIAISESTPTDALMLMLEVGLCRETDCTEIINQLVKRGKAQDALFTCKLFAAPASAILSLTATLNRPLEALTYPAIGNVNEAIPMDDHMLLTAQAIGRRVGHPVREECTVPISLLLETVAASSQPVLFGTMQSQLLSEFQKMEKEISEKRNRKGNDLIEVNRMKGEISLLQRKPIIHQLGRSCSRCKLPLSDLPVVLFRCMHGYHEHCLGSTVRCELCSNETQHHLAILGQRKASVKNHDELFKKLSGTRGNKFDVAMTYLGHGLFYV